MANLFNRDTFFDYVRRAPFGNRLTQQQMHGMEQILTEWETCYPHTDVRFLAYILATAFHETGGRMVPVREGFASSDAQARKILAKHKYAKPDPHTGRVYYGRGLVQLTWADNYRRMGNLLRIDLLSNPDRALDPAISVKILIEGMLRGNSGKGDFTGRSLEMYFNDTKDDPVGARAIVNGTDKAQLIAGYHRAFLDALKKAESVAVEPAGAPAPVIPDGPSLITDKTTLGAMTAGGGGVLATVMGAISNPYALGAFAIVAIAIGIGLYFTIKGRQEIKRNSGA